MSERGADVTTTPHGGLVAIRAWLDARVDAMVDLTARLAECESPSDVPESQAAVQRLLSERFEALGFRVRRLPGRRSGGHLLAVPRARRRGHPLQLLVGHSDTVWPSGTLSAMPVRREGDRLYGPGVFDMKGGLVQGLFALEALRAVGLRPPADPVWIVNSDEEVGSPESAVAMKRLARAACRALVLEPALGETGSIKTARKGVANYRLRYVGRPAHAGLDPGAGRSAIVAMARSIEHLVGLQDLDAGISVNPGVVRGGTRPNVVAAEASVDVDVRVRNLQQADAVDRAIRGLPPGLDGVRVEIEGGLRTPPLERTPRNRRLWRQALSVAATLGLDLAETEAGGGSDGNLISRHAATLDGLGAVGDGAHAAHEHLVVTRMPERAALVAGLLLAPLAGDPEGTTDGDFA